MVLDGKLVSQVRNKVRHQYLVVCTRDGVHLATDVYLPQEERPVPAVLIRTCYGKLAASLVDYAHHLALNGYAVAIQDVRGRYDSEGQWHPYHNNEDEDAYDTVKWLSQQSWCTGLVAAVGSSYEAFTAWMAARSGHPSLRCLISRVPATGLFRDHFYCGGIFYMGRVAWGTQTNRRVCQEIINPDGTKTEILDLVLSDCPDLLWTLPVVDIAGHVPIPLRLWREWLTHSTDDEYWRSIEVAHCFEQIDLPVMHVEGWHDVFLNVGLGNFEGMCERGGPNGRQHQKLVVGPWPHAVNRQRKLGGEDFGSEALIDLEGLELRWLDHWLKGIDDRILNEPPITLFLMGANEWRSEREWPLLRTKWTPLYLHRDGGLGFHCPGSDDSPSQYVYDPADSTPIGFVTPDLEEHLKLGAPRERDLSGRADVLIFLSPPIEEDIELVGPMELKLWAATDARDTDFFATLTFIPPNGPARTLGRGQIRGRFRSSFEKPSLLSPGEICEYRIPLGSTCRVLATGTQLRLDIQSAAMPLFCRNLNTGGDNHTETSMTAARQTVYHDVRHPSQVVLPVMPR